MDDKTASDLSPNTMTMRTELEAEKETTAPAPQTEDWMKRH